MKMKTQSWHATKVQFQRAQINQSLEVEKIMSHYPNLGDGNRWVKSLRPIDVVENDQ